MKIEVLLCGLSLCILVPAVAQAQGATFDGCVDYYGRPVVSVPNDRLGDVARAFLAPNGQPVIEYNRWVLTGVSWQSRLFWYGHECGHHALGHNFGTAHPLRTEQQADCFGITTLVEKGLIDRDDVRVIQAELSRSPGDWTHLPGPHRAINLEACLEEAGLGGSSRSHRSRGENSCEYAYDGECDEPDLCDRGTDRADCGSRRSRRRDRESTRSARLYCCDVYGNRYCPIVTNPGPVGTACGCSGLPGYGVICR